ncbi:LacI family DNA-binding transcriptional regulator [Kineosporia sp. J2-2]|uniref:LacI family DNA-binding transcriptional regulator n=1 Tax=Kineosporia corallincola TaxID=2835133 RepID=A0ABS5TQT2_9ACTN|nr:LacI family DNA-binding transcriptional regulator [Kineosporia corallincola]MBT0772209.1 LacI family DNA-binding transcriptional regulator [Kineosporia corallincola]
MSRRNPGRAPTLEQVAARAGVGRGTASRVINGSVQVSEAARNAVLRAVDDLGYVPNRAARSLVTQLTDVVALVVSEPEDRLFGEPFFGQLVRGVTASLAGTSRQLLLTMAHRESERGRLNDFLSRQHVDGVLLLSLHGDDPLPAQLAGRGVPAVLGGRPQDENPLPYVDMDNEGGAALAVEHLLAGGRRRVATITGPADMSAGRSRLEGYARALAAHGLQPLVGSGDFSENSGRRAARELLDAAPDLDAIFCASDQMAIGALAELSAAGRRVPDDVAVVGFDDSPSSRHTTPSLTTVHQPVEEMGVHMVRTLSRLIENPGEPVDDVVLPTHLVVRDSA